MRLISPGDTAPTSVGRYLLPLEAQVIAVRRHPAILLGRFGLVVAGLVAAALLSTVADFSSNALDIVWLLWGLLLLYLIWKTASWSVDYFVVTSIRMLVIEGVLARDVAMMPLALVTGIRLRRSAMGRLLGYGQFILKPVGQDQALRNINFLPYPEQLHLEVCSLLFPRPAEPPDSGRAEQFSDKVYPEYDSRDEDEERSP